MFGSWTYLLWLLFFVGLPLLVLGVLFWRIWWQQRRALGWTLAGSAAGGWAWDFTAIQWGFWSFNGTNLTGMSLLGLPIEEWLWILGVTFLFSGLALVFACRGIDAPKPLRSPSSPVALSLVPIFVVMDGWLKVPLSLSQTLMTVSAGIVFHGILWARNWRFLGVCLPIIFRVTALAIAWLLATDPIGAAWGAWIYDPTRVLGVWLFGLIPIEDVLGIIVVGSVSAGSVLIFAHSPRRWMNYGVVMRRQ